MALPVIDLSHATETAKQSGSPIFPCGYAVIERIHDQTYQLLINWDALAPENHSWMVGLHTSKGWYRGFGITYLVERGFA